MNNALNSSHLQTFSLPQLRAATQAGGVSGVCVRAQGTVFYLEIHTRSGQYAVLVTAKNRTPRQFKNPIQAFTLLRSVGIVNGTFDMTLYTPEQQAIPTPAAVWSCDKDAIDRDSAVQASFDDPMLNPGIKETKQLYALFHTTRNKR